MRKNYDVKEAMYKRAKDCNAIDKHPSKEGYANAEKYYKK